MYRLIPIVNLLASLGYLVSFCNGGPVRYLAYSVLFLLFAIVYCCLEVAANND